MSEYRNTDNVLMMFNRFYRMCKLEEQKGIVLAMKQAFLEIKPEDVVPRSEVEALKKESEILSASNKTLALSRRCIEAELNKAKQEVAKQICEEIRQEIKLALDSNYKAKDEHLNKYKDYDVQFISLVNGKILSLRGIDDFLDELEKKHVGEKQ